MTAECNKHHMGCAAQLLLKCPFTSTFFRREILTHKVNQALFGSDVCVGVHLTLRPKIVGNAQGLCPRKTHSLIHIS